MRTIEAISPDVMVAAFLLAEIGSPRFAEPIARLLAEDGRSARILEAPDLGDTAENAYRANLLARWRGYGRNEDVFTDLPADTKWFRAVLNRADFDRVKYINDSYWTDFSGGSRLVRDAVARIESGAIDAGEAACYRAFAQELAQGKRFPQIIILSNPATGDIVVLEGHIRITSYLLWLGSRSEDLPAILGVSASMKK